jgi:hypothetical protein
MRKAALTSTESVYEGLPVQPLTVDEPTQADLPPQEEPTRIAASAYHGQMAPRSAAPVFTVPASPGERDFDTGALISCRFQGKELRIGSPVVVSWGDDAKAGWVNALHSVVHNVERYNEMTQAKEIIRAQHPQCVIMEVTGNDPTRVAVEPDVTPATATISELERLRVENERLQRLVSGVL